MTETSDRKIKTQVAISLEGSQIKLGRLIGVTRQAVQHWNEYIPQRHMKLIEQQRPHWEQWIEEEKKNAA